MDPETAEELPPQPRPPVSDSSFNMWRCIIAVAHADGIVQDEELDYLKHVLAKLEREYGLTSDQRATLGEDLVEPRDIGQFLPKVTEAGDRKHLVLYAALMARKSGDLDPGEEAMMKKIGAASMREQDAERFLSDIRKHLDAKAEKEHQIWLKESEEEYKAWLKANEISGLRAVVRFVLNKIYSTKPQEPPPAT